MIKVRKERELERKAFKLAKERSNINSGDRDMSRFFILKLKNEILKELKSEKRQKKKGSIQVESK